MFAPWKKSNDKPRQYIKKKRHYFAYNFPYSQSYGFSCSHVQVWELDNEKGWVLFFFFWRIDAFKLWCWRRLLRVLWTARRSNQSILMEINTEYWRNWCWSWSSNTLATWWKELIHWKRPWCWERLKAKGEWGNRGWNGWMASPFHKT